jgi:hypothetical protein
MIKFIKRLIFSWRYKHAVKQANKFSKLFGMKYMVLFWNGEFKVVPKKNLRALVHAHRFRKGVTLADIEKRAVYVTK